MYRDAFLCHLWIWALGRMPIEWLVRDLDLAPRPPVPLGHA